MATKTSLKKWIRTDSNFTALIPSRSIRKMLANFFWSWVLTDCIKVQEKKKKIAVLCSCPRQNVLRVQSCCLGNINLVLFCRSRWRRDRRCLSFLKTTTSGTTFSALPGGVLGLIFSGYVPLACQSLYSIIVNSVANRTIARWRHLTTTTRIHFGFALLFKFVNPAED